jgi:hypothetical protein
MTDGSETHKALFCQTFIDSHRTFEPAELPWPELDAVSIERLRSIPFWDAALKAERNAGVMVTRYAETLSDPLIRQAMALQGLEEARHARLLETMLQVYNIPVPVQVSPKVRVSERSFIDFGYEECIDSFLGFGIFGLARRIQLFVPELTDIFEYVLLEEARHVGFFVNWIAFARARRGRNAAPLAAVATTLGYVRAVGRIVSTFAPSAKGAKLQGTGFSAEGAFALLDGVSWRAFLQSCIDGNEHYLSALDPRLLRPRVLPELARLALKLPSFSRCRRPPGLRLASSGERDDKRGGLEAA